MPHTAENDLVGCNAAQFGRTALMFRRTYHLQLHERRVSQATDRQRAGSNS
jgi:hypothetical protein